jgi:hypothetical protein
MSGTEKPDAIPVSAKVLDGIEAVRRSGLTNMLARDVVAEIAEEMGFEESARWVQQHRDLYARAIFHGFRVVGTETDRGVSE